MGLFELNVIILLTMDIVSLFVLVEKSAKPKLFLDILFLLTY